MLQPFINHVQNNFPFLLKSKICVACSGGIDSVVLTHLLHKMNCNITLLHCNFSLRGKESDGDEKFVVHLSKNLEIPIYTNTFNTESYAKNNNLSIQMAARELRYSWFVEIANLLKIDFVATAHHLDDDLETFLIHTFRGTGLNGLTGIPKLNGKMIRPLLPFSREEIFSYAEEHNITWREDSSNKSTKYLRNKYRLEVIPKIKEENPKALQNFKNTQSHLMDAQVLLEDYIEIVFKQTVQKIADGYKIDIEKLKSFPNTKALLYQLLHTFGFKEWEDVYHLLNAQSGKQILSETHSLLKDREFLFLKTIHLSQTKANQEVYLISENTKKISEPICLTFKEVSEVNKTNHKSIFVDKDTLKFPLLLRKWEDGDVFYPFGMQGKKKLSKFFKDEKVSLFDKKNIWLLCSRKNIIWIVGHRADDRFKISPTTKSIIKITYTNE
ncbi:MAG: tRNA lysidine(34) synthetase TilS [Flavobacteriaceae bacterium CG_4_8_14_3_um_filter_34_10]|nr:tRNA lysidine(34) synthetase TilS [Flavobacteriia bacterium]OIP50122.1 MAG: tRNA lysidine(34) synthetase TilS [Flavobacteriaceae bacterium CG2_30_34_30]PIQ18314.1 MAG: tRNA lysidine(34) synthetase TilS [Flavobacteriaceae bacterium CG18_big_fil_WC_8_21_14_2_50_34_36]PIV49451.1 MAG: tRNA lysidine(34) synthetase TilS [Flavobacteriaceae bacterium CG02_land_8_20_14_3_00_34_13]PIX09263.1 MAG: tRNA lysidine(34) synthetase TilS [Flavobacteriaceae bacterium CG_4_8_14_3_um_filter_34_10]PIZ07768.1 MAG